MKLAKNVLIVILLTIIGFTITGILMNLFIGEGATDDAVQETEEER